MNLFQLNNLVLQWLDDPNGGYFTTAQTFQWLNNAQREVHKRLIKAGENYYLRPVQTTLVINQADYVLPEDFHKLNRLEIIISGTPPNESVTPILPITSNQRDLVADTVGTPQFYHMKKNRIRLHPAPDSPKILRMDYSYAVSDMLLLTDIPDVPEVYHELIALLAAENGFIKDGREATLLEKKIKEYQDEMDEDADDRNQDMPRMVIETGTSGGSYYW